MAFVETDKVKLQHGGVMGSPASHQIVQIRITIDAIWGGHPR